MRISKRTRAIFTRAITNGERIARTDLRYLIRGSFWLFLGQAASVVTSLLLAVGYAHFLPKETYGTYKYIISIFGILSLFTISGMETGAIRGIAAGHEGVFWKSFRYRVRFGIFASLSAIGIAAYYFLHGEKILAATFAAAAPFLFIVDPLTHYYTLLHGRKLFREGTIYMTILQILNAAAIFTAVLFTDSVLFLVLAYLVAALLLRGAIFLAVVHQYPPNTVDDAEAFAFGKHLSAVTILATFAGKLDAILLFHFLGPIALAVYAFAQAAISQIQSAFKLVTQTLAFPKFVEKDKETLKRTLGRKILLAHAVTVPLAAAVVMFLPYLYRLLFPTYLESILYAQVMAALLAFAPLRFLPQAISAKANARTFYIMGIATPLFSTVALLVCVPLWGIWGAIIGSAAAQTFTNALNLYLFRRM